MTRFKLISFKLCPYVQRAAIVLLEKGVPFHRININLAAKPDWFLNMSPNGKVMTIASMETYKVTKTIRFGDNVRPFVINHDASRIYANLNNLLGFDSSGQPMVFGQSELPTSASGRRPMAPHTLTSPSMATPSTNVAPDAPVEPLNPIPSFYASISRKTLKGQPEGGYEPAEKMTREQALRSYTLDAAYGAFQEKVLGSIEAGKYADFTVFTKDIMDIPEAEILTTEVAMTVVDGRVIFEK